MTSLLLVLILMTVLRVPLPLLLLWLAAISGATPNLALHSDLPSALYQVAHYWQTLLNV
jgi:hypothetical protein